jgi:predicted  nucleic acid-binding Zn ribbon protein
MHWDLDGSQHPSKKSSPAAHKVLVRQDIHQCHALERAENICPVHVHSAQKTKTQSTSSSTGTATKP